MSSSSPIRCATALSVMLHAALLLSLGVSHFVQPADSTSVPTLQFTLDLDDGHDLEKDNAPRTEHLIQLGATSTQPSVAITDNRPTEIDPDSDTARSEPLSLQPLGESGAEDSTPREIA
ncbi:MAG TPA: hypothetical protein VGO53_12730, partial [Steroidobacteraceae bacterium]|nr:hypothetical protein [Steroidobacteraceae bacterium]